MADTPAIVQSFQETSYDHLDAMLFLFFAVAAYIAPMIAIFPKATAIHIIVQGLLALLACLFFYRWVKALQTT